MPAMSHCEGTRVISKGKARARTRGFSQRRYVPLIGELLCLKVHIARLCVFQTVVEEAFRQRTRSCRRRCHRGVSGLRRLGRSVKKSRGQCTLTGPAM